MPPAKDLVQEAWGLIVRQSSKRAEQPGVTEEAQVLKTDTLVALLIRGAAYFTSSGLDFLIFTRERLTSICDVSVQRFTVINEKHLVQDLYMLAS